MTVVYDLMTHDLSISETQPERCFVTLPQVCWPGDNRQDLCPPGHGAHEELGLSERASETGREQPPAETGTSPPVRLSLPLCLAALLGVGRLGVRGAASPAPTPWGEVTSAWPSALRPPWWAACFCVPKALLCVSSQLPPAAGRFTFTFMLLVGLNSWHGRRHVRSQEGNPTGRGWTQSFSALS